MSDVEWEVKLLGDLATSEDGAIAIGPFGSSMKSDVYVPEGVPVIRGMNLDGHPGFRGEFVFVDEDTATRFRRCVLQPGDLVFPHRGAIGSVGIAVDTSPGRWLLSTSMMKFRADPDRLDPLFAFHFFRSSQGRYQLLRNASQVGTPGIAQPLTSLRVCEIPLPPIGEQHAIAGVLGALDDKIEQNRRTAQALERLARAIFRAWFVDFEPVKAKAEGATAFPSMPQDVFDALPTTFTVSDIGPVPEGWGIVTFGDVLVLAYGKALKAGQRNPGSFPVYGSNGQVGWNDEAMVAGPGIIVGRKGNPGTVTWSTRSFFPIDTTFFVQLTCDPCSLQLLYYQLLNAGLGRLATDSAVPGINRRMVYAEQCVVPERRVLAAFDDLSMALWDMQASLEGECLGLVELRDYLLPKLVSGNVRVRDAESVAHGVFYG